MKPDFLLLVVLLVSGVTYGSTLVSRRHDDDNFALTSEITFADDGSCNIFGQDLSEDTCRWILEDEYDHLRDHYMSGNIVHQTIDRGVDLLRNGDCVFEEETYDFRRCREIMGDAYYNHLYEATYGLPSIEVDEDGFCLMGDTELAPEDCPRMIGEALYSVLVSIDSHK